MVNTTKRYHKTYTNHVKIYILKILSRMIIKKVNKHDKFSATINASQPIFLELKYLARKKLSEH